MNIHACDYVDTAVSSVLCDRTVKFWNLETMRLTSTVNGLYSPIRSLASTAVDCNV